MLFCEVQRSFPSTSVLRNQQPVRGAQDSSTDFCPTAAECGARSTAGLNARTLGGELDLLDFCLGLEGKGNIIENLLFTCFTCSTHCTSTPKRLWLQGFGNTQTPACTLTCLSSLQSTMFIEYLPWPKCRDIMANETETPPALRSVRSASTLGLRSTGTPLQAQHWGSPGTRHTFDHCYMTELIKDLRLLTMFGFVSFL